MIVNTWQGLGTTFCARSKKTVLHAQNNASTLKFTEFAIYFQIEGIIVQFQIEMVITWGANLKLPKYVSCQGGEVKIWLLN